MTSSTTTPPLTGSLTRSLASADPSKCFVCTCILADAGGDPGNIRESHHVVPRAYGGEDGPQVPLCLAHHDLTHLVAVKMIACKDYHCLLPLDPSHRQRLIALATLIKLAHSKFNQDPSKRLTLSIGMSRDEASQLKTLASTYGLSKSDLVKLLIKRELSRVIPKNVRR